MRHHLMRVVTLLVLVAGTSFGAQDPFEPSAGEAIGELLGNVGASMVEFQRLRVERKNTLAQLEKEFAQCAGRCANREELARELEKWRRIDSQARAMESDLLKGLGFGQYDDLDDMWQGLKRQALAENARDVFRIKESQVTRPVSNWCIQVKTKGNAREVGPCYNEIMSRWARESAPSLSGQAQHEAMIISVLAREELVMAQCRKEVLPNYQGTDAFPSQRMLDCMAKYSELSRLKADVNRPLDQKMQERRRQQGLPPR
jgi:hypothetical protein